MRFVAVAVVAVVAAGCAHLPEAEAVRRAEVLGAAIYEQDKVSAVATDVALGAGLLAGVHEPAGWVTMPTATGGQVDFVAGHDGAYVVTARVVFERQPDGKMKVEPAAIDAQPLTGEERARFLASRTALAHPLPACPGPINPVVLPATLIGEQGWLVYLLPAQAKREELPIALRRFHVSADGTTVLDAQPLTRSCAVLQLGGGAVGLVITHALSDTPMEHHVYANLATHLSLTVLAQSMFFSTGMVIWRIDDGHVTKVK